MVTEHVSSRAKSPLKWHGGKTYMAQRIIDLMPPHTRYCEPFFVGGSVLFRKSPEGVAEFANDLDGDLANFWTVLRKRRLYNRFIWEVSNTPLSREVFGESVARLNQESFPHDEDDCIERAIAFFTRYRQSRQGLGKDFCTPTSRTRRGMNENVSAWLSAVDGLPDAHSRLRRVEIWNVPAIEFIRKLDSPATLYYADPTYAHGTRVTRSDYRFEMTDQDHVELLACLASIEGKFLLSGYRNALYDDRAKEHGWHRLDIEIDNKASGQKSKPRKIESLWANFPLEES